MINDRVPSPFADVNEYRSEGKTLVWRGTDGAVFYLNGSAETIWARCDGKASVDEICSTLATTFELPPSALREDVEAALERLAEAGFIQWK